MIRTFLLAVVAKDWATIGAFSSSVALLTTAVALAGELARLLRGTGGIGALRDVVALFIAMTATNHAGLRAISFVVARNDQ